MKFRTKQYPHQRRAMRRAIEQGSHAFFFEPRLGKTKAVLDTVSVLNSRGKVKKVLVIAPLIALDVWVQEIQKHLSVGAVVEVVGEPAMIFTPWAPKEDRLRAAKGKKPKKITLRFYLINYDKFSRRGEDEAYRNDYLRAVEQWAPDVIVCDESHRVKSAGAVRSQSLWRMVRRLRERSSGGRPYVYLLTGTPNPKGYIDLFAQYRLLDEGIFGTSKQGFEQTYCMYGFGTRRYTIIAYRNKERLLKKIRGRATVVTSKKAGLDGKLFPNPVHISLPPNVRRAYDQLAEEFMAELDGKVMDAANAGVRRTRLLQLTGGFTTDGEVLHRAKIEAVSDWLRDLSDQGEAVVVYARFLPELFAIESLCRRLKLPHRAIHGAVKRKDRSEWISEFQEGEGARVILLQANVGSLAIELSAAAELVYYSLPDSWESFYQSLQRVRGPNQHRPVRYTTFLCKGTVDLAVLQTLRNKRDMHGEMMRSPRSFLYGL